MSVGSAHNAGLDNARLEAELEVFGHALLERLDDVLDRLVERMRTVLPIYAAVPAGGIRSSARGLWEAAIRGVFLERREPRADELAQMAALAGERARQGITLDKFVLGVTLTAENVWPEIETVARELAVGDTTLLSVRVAMDRWNNAMVRYAVQEHHRTALASAREDERKRVSLLRDLLAGELADDTLSSRVAEIGLNRDRAYQAFHATASTEHSLRDLEGAITDRAAAFREPLLCAVSDGVLSGITPHLRVDEVGDATVGLGPAMELASVANSYQQARRAHLVARSYALHGVYRLEDLSVRAAMVAEPQLTKSLRDRYIAPLRTLSGFGAEVLDTIEALLDNGFAIDATAQAMHLHRNTVRYRMRRYEEVTGADLSRTDVLVEMWWAFHAPSGGEDTG